MSQNMKKTGSFNSRSTAKKQPETKSSSFSRSAGKINTGSGSAAFNRRSPVVTDATIATNSVIQAATDPKIKELVMKQQQIFERESMDKRTPRNRSVEAASALFHSLDHTLPSAAQGDTVEKAHAKFNATSPDLHGQQHHHHHAPSNVPNTPGSAVETVVHPDGQDDDGVSSELTADAGYMTLQYRSAPAPSLPTMSEQACSVSPAAHTGTSASSPSVRGHNMHAYMSMNSSLLHEHTAYTVSGNAGKDVHASPLQSGLTGAAGGAVPPPLVLPQSVVADGSVVNTTTTAANASTTALANAVPAILPDPRELDDQTLRAAYLRFMAEMESRGLHSLSLNPAPAGQVLPPPPPTAAMVALNLSSSSSCAGGAGGPGVATVMSASNGAAGVSMRQESPHTSIAYNERTTATTANSTTGANSGNANRTTPNALHSTLPPHLNPNINPVDIRKNVTRSKSGGSEAAFYPNTPLSGTAASATPTVASGRKTPNSPLMGRYMHSNEAPHEELHWVNEGENAELREAFGHYRHPGSPSYPAYSPFHHLSSGAPQPSYLQQHSAHAQGFHTGSTPTSVAVGSANWTMTSTSAPATTTTTTAHTTTNTAHGNTHGSRSVSRCSGVVPQVAHDDLLPAMRNNCLSTLPPTHQQYMYTQSASGAGNGGNGGAANGNAAPTAARSVDLKMPKFVRKFHGMGAGLLGFTSQRYAHMEGDDDSVDQESTPAVATTSNTSASNNTTTAAAAASQAQPSKGRTPNAGVQVGGPGKHSGNNGTSQGSAVNGGSGAVGGSSRPSGNHRVNLHSMSDDYDNSIDAVKIAGGFDQLLLPGRLLSKRNSSLIPDEHSAFDDCSVGSMSLNSARSGGKKSAKTR